MLILISVFVACLVFLGIAHENDRLTDLIL